MAEEEREGLTDFRRLARLQQRHDLAIAHLLHSAARNGGDARAAHGEGR